MEVKDELVFNFMLDMRKKDIDPLDKAQMIQAYMEQKCISMRGLANQLGIPHTTIHGWLVWNKINKEQYAEMKKNGLTNTDIYRELEKNEPSQDLKTLTKIDQEITKFRKTIRPYIHNPPYSPQTIMLIKDMINDLNKIQMYIEKHMRGKNGK